MQRLIFANSTFILFGTFVLTSSASGQIIPDRTTNTTVINNCQAACDLVGGVVAGENLFHSFEEFNIAPEAKVYFQDPGVANIFSRVTGNNPSYIFGTLGVKGEANLFLLNPNGIIFGEGAALDLNGSFFATTADEIQFGDRNFTAIPDESDLALLTVNPSAFLFTQMNSTGGIKLENAELTAARGQKIALLGRGDGLGIELRGSTISVAEGSISLSAINDSAQITLQEDWQLEFPADITFADIEIAERSQISARNQSNLDDTTIRIDSNNLNIRDGSKISTTTTGIREEIKGADIAIEARSSVTITGEDSSAFQTFAATNLVSGGNASLNNGLETATFGLSNAGNIEIVTQKLLVDRGAGIVSITRNQGKSGNINLDIAENMRLTSSGLLTGSGTFSSGDVGEIIINTNELVIEQNSAISSSTLGKGNAGSLSIRASELLTVKDTSADAIIPTGIFTNTIFENGDGGNLKIDTPELILQNGGQLSASSGAVFIAPEGLSFIRSGGKGGNIELEIGESLKVGGISAGGTFPSSILSDTRSSNLAGNVRIRTGDLDINSDGLISASSLDRGAGGNIAIAADRSIKIEGGGIDNLQALIISGLSGELDPANVKGGIAAYSVGSGKAGSIAIDTDSLDLDLGAIISTATYGEKDAGDLTIEASEVIKVKGSAIISPTFGTGNGGNINLKTKNLNITQGGAVASASADRGAAGDIKILATESIAIFDIIPDLLFSGSISTGSYRGFGVSGNLTIDTQRLSIKDGANIETNNVFLDFSESGKTPQNMRLETIDARTQGKLIINATQSIEIFGTAEEANVLNESANSHIHSITNILNPASNVEINTGKLSISDGGEISVRSFGRGAAGTLKISADSVILNDRSNINGTTVSGRGGNIDLQVEGILAINNRSTLNTNASQGNGGNIDITADFVIARSQSSIAAQALLEGNGGNIEITANDIFFTSDSSINAESALGIDGTVKLETLFNTERNNLTRLPQQVMQADSKVTRSCSGNGDRQGIFSYTGRGGLPFNPLTDFMADDIIVADLDIPQETEASPIDLEAKRRLNLLPPPTVEANQWQVNVKGKIELTATNSSTAPNLNSSYCPFAN